MSLLHESIIADELLSDPPPPSISVYRKVYNAMEIFWNKRKYLHNNHLRLIWHLVPAARPVKSLMIRQIPRGMIEEAIGWKGRSPLCKMGMYEMFLLQHK